MQVIKHLKSYLVIETTIFDDVKFVFLAF